MPRIDEMPQYRAKLPKSVHDLSHKFGFTATVAHLMPIFHDFLNPGETVELGFNYNLRTQPLQSAAMVDIKSHVEYFFVPMQLLYSPFGNVLYNIEDSYSSNFPVVGEPSVNVNLPLLRWSDVLTAMQSFDSEQIGFEEWANHAYRLLDLLGFNNTDLNKQSSKNYNPNVFPYQFLAYHCIYQYYYRLDNRERFNQHLFNWDKYYNDIYASLADASLRSLLCLHYRPKDSDYFTDCKVSPIVDVLNLNTKDELMTASSPLSRVSLSSGRVLSSGGRGIVSADVADSPLGDDFVYPDSEIQTNFGFRADNGSPDNPTFNGQDINTANIRAMFASEKLWSITGRAKKHYDDQTLAHFGFKVPHDVKHEISCFGHDRGLIHIGEVIATAGTDSTPLGEIAGKGYGNLSTKPHKFTAPCHGVVMVILSFVPDISYGQTFGKYNAIGSAADFYKPEYDHLGMQPLFHYEGYPDDQSNLAKIVGWQYRYEQWKRRYNRVSKAFCGSGNLDSWMLDFRPSDTENAANTENYLDYLHSPSELDQIMLVNYVTGLPAADETKTYDGDPFVVDGFIHCKKVSTMSDYSLPRLDA